MAGSARMMQEVAVKLEKTLENQNVLLHGLVDAVHKMASHGSVGGFGSGIGLGGLGGGIKRLAGGLGDLARILPQLTRGLSMFAKTSSNRFITFVSGLRDAMGKNPEKDAQKYTAFSKAIDSLSHGISKMAWGLFLFEKLTNEKENKKFILFIKDLSAKFAAIDGKKMKEGAEGMTRMAQAVFLFGLSLAVSSVLYVVGAIGSLVIVPIIAGYALLFTLIGKEMPELRKGAEAVAIMGLGIIAMSLGILAAGELAGGFDKLAAGSLIVMLGIVVFSLVFTAIGEDAKLILEGSLALIASGIAIASLALGLGVMMAVTPDITSLLMAAASIVVIGLALTLIGGAAPDIALGAAALILSGFALASLALGIAAFGLLKITWKEMGMAGVAILGIGTVMAAVGLMAIAIIPGAIALAAVGLSMIVLTAGLFFLGLVYKKAETGLLGMSADGKTTNLEVVIKGITNAFSINLLNSALMLAGAIALMVVSGAMIVLSIGLFAISKVYEKAVDGVLSPSKLDPTKSNLEVMIGGIVSAFAINPVKSVLMLLGAGALLVAGAAMTVLSIGIWAISKAYKGTEKLFEKKGDDTNFAIMMKGIADGMELGPVAAFKLGMGAAAYLGASLALITIAIGISRFSDLVKQKIDINKIDDMIKTVITSVAHVFVDAGPDGKLINWKLVKKGVSAVSDVGNLIKGIAEGVAKMAELKFPIYGDDGKITGYFGIDDGRFGQVATNIKRIIVCIGDALTEIGASQGETKWFSKTNAEKGAAAIRGVGADLVGIADFVMKVADLRIQKYDENTGLPIQGAFVKIEPKDLEKDGSIRKNIKNIITSISDAFAAVGSGDSAKAGWFSKSDIERGKLAIMGVADDVSKMAQAAKNVSDIKDIETTKKNIAAIVIAFPQAIVNAYNVVVKNLKGTTLGEMSAQLSSAAEPLSSFIEVLTKYQDKKIKDATSGSLANAVQSVLGALNKPISNEGLTALGQATEYISKLATSADAIDKLSNAFGKLSKSIDVFAGAFKKMDKDVLKNSDMLIQSFVLFAKVDPSAFDKNGIKAQELLNFIYDKAKPATQDNNPATGVTTAPVPADQPGYKKVEAGAPADKAGKEHAAKQAALEQSFSDMQTQFSQMQRTLEDIKNALLSPTGMKVRMA